jgi:hypothetical protein
VNYTVAASTESVAPNRHPDRRGSDGHLQSGPRRRRDRARLPISVWH